MKPTSRILPDFSFAVSLTALLLTAILSRAGAAETVWLSELDLTQVQQGWGKAQADKAVQGGPLTIQGRTFERGVGTHAPGGMTIELPEDAARFSAWVGIDDSVPKQKGSVEFQVWGNGQLRWRSGVMRGGQEAKQVELDLAGVQRLALVVSDACDGIECDQAAWADAQIRGAGARPKVVPFVHPLQPPGGLGKSAASLATPVFLPFAKKFPGPITEWAVLTVGGQWCKEYLFQPTLLPETGFRFIQKAGRSCQVYKPWFIVWNMKRGEGLALALAYSGNWSFEIKPDGEGIALRLAASPPALKPFETRNGLPIPGALVAEFTGHWDCGAQPIVRFIRQKLLRDLGPDWPPVQFNTWYANYEKISEKSLLDAARAANEMGCELFTVDAGWYGEDDWSASVGNWQVNKARLPNGLEPVVAEVRRLGMKFGLWIEIENVSPKSAFGKEHADWFLRNGTRMVSDRATLDFGNPEALAWAKAQMDRLVTAYQLDYIKIDFNTDLPVDSEKSDAESDPLYRHYRGLVEFWKHLRTRHPKLIVENCASGSLRQDVMAAAFTDTHWVSDNVEPGMNLAAIYGATYLFPPEICSYWTTSTAPIDALDVESLFTVNMMGHLGLSGKIETWDDATRQVAAERIALYKKLRPLIRKSDVFHLTDQADALAPRTLQAALYVDPKTGQALLFAFQGGAPSLEARVPLRGLDPERRYRLAWPAAFGTVATHSGRGLLDQGLLIRFPKRGASVILPLDPAD